MLHFPLLLTISLHYYTQRNSKYLIVQVVDHPKLANFSFPGVRLLCPDRLGRLAHPFLRRVRHLLDQNCDRYPYLGVYLRHVSSMGRVGHPVDSHSSASLIGQVARLRGPPARWPQPTLDLSWK